METKPKKIWFPAKRYGWGWGPPCAWQGWVVFILFLILLPAGMLFLIPRSGISVAVEYAGFLSVILFFICLWKGEKPRWRWGGD